MTSTLPAPPERAKSQPQRVFDSVAARIRGGLLKPGERVPSEPELMRELGVSRTVVREAMSRLQASGMVETRQGVGTFVLAPSVGDALLNIDTRQVKLRQVFAMLELRVSLESDAASLAATRRTDAQLAAMTEETSAEDVQTAVYEIGKTESYGFESLRDWFKALYETLLGSSQGPRMGSFIALYGVENTRKLIAEALG